MPNADEVAGLKPGSDPSNPRDIIVDDRTVGLKRISALHPSFTAMQYPVLFPYAEIPYEKEDPAGYNAVKQFMMHGPCGDSRPHNSCVRDRECNEHYPKRFNSLTYVDENGFQLYKRRADGMEIIGKDNILLDNRVFVPYHRNSIIKYQAHINAEWCNRAKSIKYLFKYITKGPDGATMVIEKANETSTNRKDERSQVLSLLLIDKGYEDYTVNRVFEDTDIAEESVRLVTAMQVSKNSDAKDGTKKVKIFDTTTKRKRIKNNSEVGHNAT
ncbi:hypothetical protein RJ639_037961 [Escallonia herrerae]|uniref:Uncharacterized protein n=1 Tax=Escallonia herrerae TaxID=1293975 RepID=A0AA88WNG7_9ASTE|nr:hypothetical protein RJ639_037961 [Escallonia herrerae]